MGCVVESTAQPAAGSSGFGAVIVTPAMGPATVGLSGFELFWTSQAHTTRAVEPASSTRYGIFMTLPQEPCVGCCLRPRRGRQAGNGPIGFELIRLSGAANQGFSPLPPVAPPHRVSPRRHPAGRRPLRNSNAFWAWPPGYHGMWLALSGPVRRYDVHPDEQHQRHQRPPDYFTARSAVASNLTSAPRNRRSSDPVSLSFGTKPLSALTEST